MTAFKECVVGLIFILLLPAIIPAVFFSALIYVFFKICRAVGNAVIHDVSFEIQHMWQQALKFLRNW